MIFLGWLMVFVMGCFFVFDCVVFWMFVCCI